MGGERGRDRDWFWEANVQACVLEHMRGQEGFTILSSGHPGESEQGLEIVAERRTEAGPIHRLVSVRGWPSQVYTRGTLTGQLRPNRPELAARGWIAQAIFDLALNRGADPGSELALALPAMASYIRYLQRLRWFLGSARVWVYLVSQEGEVSLTPPGAAPVSAAVLAPPPLPPSAKRGARRKLGLPGSARLRVPLLHALVLAGGTASRAECIESVAHWFPGIPQPPPVEFGQRLSIAQNELQAEGLTEPAGRGRWSITLIGREAHETQLSEWLAKEGLHNPSPAGRPPEPRHNP